MNYRTQLDELEGLGSVEDLEKFKDYAVPKMKESFRKNLGFLYVIMGFILILNVDIIIKGEAGYFTIFTTIAMISVMVYVFYKGYYKMIYGFEKEIDRRIKELS